MCKAGRLLVREKMPPLPACGSVEAAERRGLPSAVQRTHPVKACAAQGDELDSLLRQHAHHLRFSAGRGGCNLRPLLGLRESGSCGTLGRAGTTHIGIAGVVDEEADRLAAVRQLRRDLV